MVAGEGGSPIKSIWSRPKNVVDVYIDVSINVEVNVRADINVGSDSDVQVSRGCGRPASTHTRMLGNAENDEAGIDVAVINDIDGDGADESLIGAHQESTTGMNAGAAYLLYGDTSW